MSGAAATASDASIQPRRCRTQPSTAPATNHSGIDSIAIKAKELGIALTTEEQQAALAAVKRAGTEKRGLVTDIEFRAITERVKHAASA